MLKTHWELKNNNRYVLMPDEALPNSYFYNGIAVVQYEPDKEKWSFGWTDDDLCYCAFVSAEAAMAFVDAEDIAEHIEVALEILDYQYEELRKLMNKN